MSRDVPPEKFRAWLEDRGVSERALKRIFSKPNYFNVARMTPYVEDWIILMNSVGMGCLRGRVADSLKGNDWVDIYSSVTGFDTSLEELRRAASRIYNLYKALNVRLGFSRKDDIFPELWFKPLITTDRGTLALCDYYGNPLSKEDCKKLLDDYYDERGWDAENGIPKEHTLIELGLEDVVRNLKKRGFLRV
jgi:aldehyde:ferredoxin oxidoreductase